MSVEIEDNSDRKMRLEKTQAEISRMTRDLTHCTDENILATELAKLKEKENEIVNKNHNLFSSKSEFNYQLKSLAQSSKSTQKSLKDLRSAENQKLNQLKKSNKDCYDAVMYLRNHLGQWRTSGRFR